MIADAGHNGPDKNLREAAGSAAQGNIKIKSPNSILPGHSYQGIIEHCRHAGYVPAVSNPPFISIIDDDESVREALWGLVRSVGFAVSTFASAEEFLNSGHFGNADCLILDVCMPGMGGIELQRQLVAGHCDVPVIFITAHEDEGMRAQALRGGAEAVLIKPFSEEALLTAIHTALSPR